MPELPLQAPQPLAWDALDHPRIGSKPKAVIQDDEFILAIDLSEAQLRDYAMIVSLIRIGGDLEPYYRRSETADRLLKTRQILHMHLGGPGSNAILYVIQYPEHAATGLVFVPASEYASEGVLQPPVVASAGGSAIMISSKPSNFDTLFLSGVAPGQLRVR